MATVTSFPLETVPFTSDITIPSFEARGIIVITETRFGAHLVTGTAAERLASIQAAFDYGADNGCAVYIPAGTWIIDGTLNIPSNSWIKGAGRGKTIIKMADDVARNVNVMVFGDDGDPRENILMEDFTVEANATRWSTTGGTGNGIAMRVTNTQNATFNRIHVANAINHCWDIAAVIDPVYAWSSGEYQYWGESSKKIYLNECSATGAGDDNFAVHHSSWVYFTRCHSYDPGGPGKGNHNSNCFEIDDGSRNIFLTDCLAERGHSGIQIKAHGGGPAPYNVVSNGFTAVNCASGVQLRHSNGSRSGTDMDTDHEGTTTAFDYDTSSATVWANSTSYTAGDFVIAPTSGTVYKCLNTHTSASSPTTFGQDIAANPTYWGVWIDNVLTTPGTIDDAYSPTAYNIKFINTTIIAPKIPDAWVSGGDSVGDLGGIVLQNYSGVLFSNTTITDGSEDFGNKEYQAYSFTDPNGSPSTGVIRISTQARRLTFRDTFINGFAGEEFGIVCNSTAGDSGGVIDLTIDGLIMRNAPLKPIQFNAALGNLTVNNYFISGDHIGDSTIGINFGGTDTPLPEKQSTLGFGEIRGYDTLILYNGASYTEELFAPSKNIVGRVHFMAGNTARAPIRMATGSAPSSPDATDIWRTSGDLGTITTGTVMLDPRDIAMKYYTNDGAHALTVASVDGVSQLLVTNGASAGAIDTSVFNFVLGDALSTTNGHRFVLTSRRINVQKVLTIEALQ